MLHRFPHRFRNGRPSPAGCPIHSSNGVPASGSRFVVRGRAPRPTHPDEPHTAFRSARRGCSRHPHSAPPCVRRERHRKRRRLRNAYGSSALRTGHRGADGPSRQRSTCRGSALPPAPPCTGFHTRRSTEWSGGTASGRGEDRSRRPSPDPQGEVPTVRRQEPVDGRAGPVRQARTADDDSAIAQALMLAVARKARATVGFLFGALPRAARRQNRRETPINTPWIRNS